jgi:hypothetical protein
MHLFVNNMADPDISDYEFDADDLIFVISRPRDMQEYIFYAQYCIRMDSKLDLRPSNLQLCREIFKYNTVIS